MKNGWTDGWMDWHACCLQADMLAVSQIQSINQTIGLTCKLSSVRITLMHRKNRLAADCSRKKFSLSSCLKLPGEVAQRVFADKLFQTTGAECLKAHKALAVDDFGFSRFRVFLSSMRGMVSARSQVLTPL